MQILPTPNCWLLHNPHLQSGKAEVIEYKRPELATVATSTTSQTSIASHLQPTTVTGHWLPHTFRMLDTFLSFCSSASFYSAIVMLSLWLWKELTMGIYRGKERLDGKLVVITGANCGIGLEVRNIFQMICQRVGVVIESFESVAWKSIFAGYSLPQINTFMAYVT